MFNNKKLHNALIKVAARKVVYDALVAGMTGPMEKRALSADWTHHTPPPPPPRSVRTSKPAPASTVPKSQFNVPRAGDEKVGLLPKWYNSSNFMGGAKAIFSPSRWAKAPPDTVNPDGTITRHFTTGQALSRAFNPFRTGKKSGDPSAVYRYGADVGNSAKIIAQAATGTHPAQKQMGALKKTDPSKYNKIRSDLGMSGNQGYLSKAIGDTYSPFRESALTRGAGFYKRNPWTAVDHAATASAFLPVGAVAGGAVKGTHLAAKGLMNAPRAIGAGIQGLKGLGAGAKGLGAGAKMKAVGSGLKAGAQKGQQWLGNSPSLPWNRAMGGWSIQAPNAPGWLKTLGTMTGAAPLVSKAYKPISKLPGLFPKTRHTLAKGVQGPLGEPLTRWGQFLAPSKFWRLGGTAIAGGGVAEAARSVAQGEPLRHASWIMNKATAAPGWMADKTIGAGARAFVNQTNRSREARRNFAAARGGVVAPTRSPPVSLKRPGAPAVPSPPPTRAKSFDDYYPPSPELAEFYRSIARGQ